MAMYQQGGGYATSLGWSVGRFEWLNDPSSKVNRYWRVIEYGSNATDWPWQGQQVVGLWGPNAGPRGRLIQGDLSAFQTGRGDQKFVPFFRSRGGDMIGAARAALYFFFGGGHGKNMDLIKARHTGREGARGGVTTPEQRMYFWLMTKARLEDMPFVQGVIMREVAAGSYYARALEFFNPMQRELDALREHTALFRTVSKGTPTTLDPSSAAGVKHARTVVGGDAGQIGPRGGTMRERRPEKVSLAAGPTGAAYLVTVDATVNAQDYIRDAKGRFTGYQGDIAKVNRMIAIQFQNEVVRLMAEERRRPVSGDLVRATSDDRNRFPR